MVDENLIQNRVLSGARLAIFERAIHVEPPEWKVKGGTYQTLEEAKSLKKSHFRIGSEPS